MGASYNLWDFFTTMSLLNRPVYLARLTTVIEEVLWLGACGYNVLMERITKRAFSAILGNCDWFVHYRYLRSPSRRCLSTNTRAITKARISADRQAWCLPFCNTLLDKKTRYICLHWLGHESERRHAIESQSAQKLPLQQESSVSVFRLQTMLLCWLI